MFYNNLVLAWRKLKRDRTFTAINVLGLAMGIAAFLLILEFVSQQRQVNGFHANLPNMYRLLSGNAEGESWPEVEPGWAPLAKAQFPEVIDYCRFETGIGQGIVLDESGSKSFREEKIGYAEGNFFSFFSFPLLKGKAEFLKNPDVAFISESYANKYFDSEDPIGQTLRLANQFGEKSYLIQGVFKDMGENSSFQYDMVFSLETLRNKANLGYNDWASLDQIDNQYTNCLFQLKPGTNYRSFEKKLNQFRKERLDDVDGSVFYLQPFSQTHLAASLSDNLHHTGQLRNVYIMGLIAALMLLIAWFNYINLSTAKALQRAAEVSVRKVIGAKRGQLVSQFLSESLLVNVFGFVLAGLLALALQSGFNRLIGAELTLGTLFGSNTWLTGVGLLVLGGLGSGAYTAYALSNFEPIAAIKGQFKSGTKGAFLRKSLVVAQFAITTGLILFTIVIYSQIRHMQQQDLGLNIERMLVVKGPQIGRDSTYKNRKNAFLQEIQQQALIVDFCTSGSVPSQGYNFNTAGFTSPKSQPNDEEKSYACMEISRQFLPAYGAKLAAGRNFTAAECEVAWNDNSKILLNEAAAKSLGFEHPEDLVSKKIRWDERFLDVVGIIADYHHQGLQQGIAPTIYFPTNNSAFFSLKLAKTDDVSQQIRQVEKLFKAQFGGNPFDYFFADENYNKLYQAERGYGALFSIAAIWAIFIACLGLYGLSVFMVEARTKEVGVRKVLGASISSITALLTSDFLKLVIFGIVIVSPLAWYYMRNWLNNFAYHTNVSWWMFALSALLAILIAVLTVGYQSVRTAIKNPVDSLRSE
jgi:putative ABC transport system permease protein